MGYVPHPRAGAMSADRLAILTHELRSPVAALDAIAAAYPTADGATRDRLVVLARAAVASIERLLSDATIASVRLERLDAALLIREATDAAILGGASIVADGALGLDVNADPERLRQVLDNLISNAIGHSPVGAAVTVSARAEATSIVIEVSDEGDGIDVADFELVFDPGVRLTSARSGSGLGLAVVRVIARAHGGEVEVKSSPGQGATFRLVLPRASGAD